MTTEPATEQLTPERLADLIAEYALDKKAHRRRRARPARRRRLHRRLRDLHGHERPAGQGDPRRASTSALKNDHGLLPRRVEGLTESRWVLMDYWDVVVHIFTPEARDFYRLEPLWGDVPKRAFEAGPDGADAP